MTSRAITYPPLSPLPEERYKSRDRRLKQKAEELLEIADNPVLSFDAQRALDALSELAGYRIDWISEPVRLVRL